MKEITKKTQLDRHRSTHYYSSADVKNHCTEDDLWMIIYNKVYNLTEFVELHPGGGEVMIDCAGVDATEAFEDVGHSDDALDMLDPYYVGDLLPGEHKPYKTSRAKFLEAENKVKRLRYEKAMEAKRRKKSKIYKKMVERFTIILLALVVLGTLSIYFALQRAKLGYYRG